MLDSAGRPPHEIALDDLQGRRRTWVELDERASCIARLLRDDLCLQPNEHAAVLMENRAEVVEIILGAMLAGVWLTPVNHHLTAEEVAYVVQDSGARVLLTDAAHESVARAAQRHVHASSCADDDAAASGCGAFMIGDIGYVDTPRSIDFEARLPRHPASSTCVCCGIVTGRMRAAASERAA